ncbi:MAG: GDP-L-fucose synthase [Roseovarius sp.]|nr:GDP-L-fucose synthase [Roseovarius sp.]MCY4317560.1 GDP-L-fucose synthase [Roseovarius sp.]
MGEIFSLEGMRVYVAGHNGMVGAAVMRRLERENCQILVASHGELDLTRQSDVEGWFSRHKPDVVIVAAAKVGGILANDSYPAEFLYKNLMIESNVIHTSYVSNVKKLLFLGSSCIYPKMASQPMNEDELLTGSLEPTNQWYAIAKIAGIKMCQAYRRQHGTDFVSAMPTNLYGTGDNYDLESSHVLPALIRKVVDARDANHDQVVVWGSGKPLREFMHVDDLADALVFLLCNYSEEQHVNVGSGQELSIRDLAFMIAKMAGYDGKIVHDRTKPDGTPRKLMDSERIFSMGWQPGIGLEDGLSRTIEEYSNIID